MKTYDSFTISILDSSDPHKTLSKFMSSERLGKYEIIHIVTGRFEFVSLKRYRFGPKFQFPVL